jgi:hypothetical protein
MNCDRPKNEPRSNPPRSCAELGGDQATHLGGHRSAPRGPVDPARVDRAAPGQDVQPDVVLKPHEIGAHELRHLLLELGDGGGADLQQPVDVGGADLDAVDLDRGDGVLPRSSVSYHHG